MSAVSIARCASYDLAQVTVALKDCLAPLGGLGAFVHPGQTVLLKPNLLSAKPPEAAVTTNPSVVEAVAAEVLALGATPVIGDSPPFQGQSAKRYQGLCRVTGMRGVADRLDVEIVSLDHPWRLARTGGERFKELPFATAVLDADVIINLPKLKTHGLTAYTGAIKNTFGHIPGLKKSQLHLQAREDRVIFAEMLVDVFATRRPELTVMDAIECMDGAGPSKGRVIQAGVLFAGADAAALDTLALEMIGIPLADVAHVRIAGEHNLGETCLDRIEVLGEMVRVRDFRPSPTIGSGLAGMPSWLYPFVRNQFVPMPRVEPAICVGCGDCVKVCPAGVMQLVSRGGKHSVAQADLRDCIACYCCDEACAHDAIAIHKGWLGELVKRTRRKRESPLRVGGG